MRGTSSSKFSVVLAAVVTALSVVGCERRSNKTSNEELFARLQRVLAADDVDEFKKLQADGLPPLLRSNAETELPALYYASGECAPRIVSYLLTSGVDPHLTGTPKRTSWAAAIEMQCWSVLDVFLAHGLKIDDVDSWGRTPLAVAAQSGHAESVRQLVKRGADPKLLKEGDWPPIFSACAAESPDALKLLLELGADASVVRPDGGSATFFAARDIELLRPVLAAGAPADVPYQSEHDNTPLMEAVGGRGSGERVKLLVAHGANVHHLNSNGESALAFAVLCADVESVRALVQAGADPNQSVFLYGRWRTTPKKCCENAISQRAGEPNRELREILAILTGE